MKRRSVAVSGSLMWLALLCAARDWPQWRGPQRTAISEEKNLLQSWPKEGPKVLWQLSDVGDGYASPAVAGSRVYMLSNRGMDNEFVQALSIDDGKQIWSTRLGGVGNPNQQPSYPMARSTPTIEGNFLYAFSSDGDLACMRADSGKIVWTKNVRRDFGGQPGTWAYSESPLIDGDVLVVTPGGPDATLVALKKSSGELIWKSAVPGGDRAGYSSAVIINAAGRKQYVQFLDKGLVGVDANSGKFLWRYTQTSGGPANIATPVTKGNYVYSTNARRFGAGLIQLNGTNDGVAAEQVYFERDLPNTLGGQVLLGGLSVWNQPARPCCLRIHHRQDQVALRELRARAPSPTLMDGCIFTRRTAKSPWWKQRRTNTGSAAGLRLPVSRNAATQEKGRGRTRWSRTAGSTFATLGISGATTCADRPKSVDLPRRGDWTYNIQS